MIELFDYINKRKGKTVSMKCENLPFWKEYENKLLLEFIQYIFDNQDLFCYKRFEVHYQPSTKEKFIRSFDIEIEMSEESYEYLYESYGRLMEKYHKYIIALDEIQFFNMKKLRLH